MIYLHIWGISNYCFQFKLKIYYPVKQKIAGQILIKLCVILIFNNRNF